MKRLISIIICALCANSISAATIHVPADQPTMQAGRQQAPSIVSTSPTQNELNVSVSANISVTFDMDMDETTINDSTFVVHARSTGLHAGTITYDSLAKTATFYPSEDYNVGELVTVAMTSEVRSSQGVPLGSSYVWSFIIVVNNGCGTLVLDSVYDLEEGSSCPYVADLDRDGDLDVACRNELGDDITILFNSGNAIFVIDSVYGVGSSPEPIVGGDLDRDNDIDLVVGHWGSHDVWILLNSGDGTFTTDSVYPGGGYNLTSVYVADLNGDGFLDLMTSSWHNNVSTLLNNGNGTFGDPTIINIQVPGYLDSRPFAVFAADLDGDGDLDLATANRGAYSATVLINSGNGVFGSQSDYFVGDYPRSVYAADLNGDSHLDLVTANSVSHDVSVLLNDGSGVFIADSAYPVDGYPPSVVAADLDGDGDQDLVTGSGNVSVLLNHGNGTFSTRLVFPGGISVSAGDVDGDGDLDVFSSGFTVSVNDFICGNINGSGQYPDVSDLTYFIDYFFRGGPPPVVMEAANVDGNNGVNVADLTYLVDYLFRGGPSPNCAPVL
jgi:hypothetical protein